jgi:glycosyltransferase involved in cell wall biosynthesis
MIIDSKVDILLPTYNGKYIQAPILSLLEQTHLNILFSKMIVVSIKQSLNIGKNSRVKIIKGEKWN